MDEVQEERRWCDEKRCRHKGPGVTPDSTTSKAATATAAKKQMDAAIAAMMAQRPLLIMLAKENTPFKYPVVECEKTYKNQNRLKYGVSV